MSTQRSDAQIEASRHNAALSRLPVTGEGKAAGSRSGTRRAFVSGTRGRKLNYFIFCRNEPKADGLPGSAGAWSHARSRQVEVSAA
jgi:hypothetical protein